MDDNSVQQRTPFFLIWLCGAFRVERRVGTTYEAVCLTDWGSSSYPRLLLKSLLCSPGRQARREALIENATGLRLILKRRRNTSIPLLRSSVKSFSP